jgi:hypothetical protein
MAETIKIGDFEYKIDVDAAIKAGVLKQTDKIMNVRPIPSSIYETAKSLNIKDIVLKFQNGNFIDVSFFNHDSQEISFPCDQETKEMEEFWNFVWKWAVLTYADYYKSNVPYNTGHEITYNTTHTTVSASKYKIGKIYDEEELYKLSIDHKDKIYKIIMRKVTVELKVKLVLNVDEGVDVSDVINELNYNFEPGNTNTTVKDQEIVDFDILDSK